MKTIKINLFLILSLLLLSSCEKDLPIYNNNECYLKFIYKQKADTLLNYSFAYGQSMVDTVWLYVQIMGSPVDRDRAISLQQIQTGDNNAVVGEHFVSFEDPILKEQFYYIPKGEISRKIPVVLKRSSSLKLADYKLNIAFKENDEFKYGSKENAYETIIISDKLTKPRHWNSYCSYYLGAYGTAKHLFMINVTGKKWDDNYIDNEWYNYFTKDSNYCRYMNDVFSKALEEYESKNGKLYEADKTPVSFPNFGY